LAFLITEGPEHARPRQPVYQHFGLLLRTRLPQRVQQAGHGVRVVEGGVGGVAGGQRGGLVPRTRLPQRVQQAGHGVRVVEGGVGGGPAGGEVVGGVQPVQIADKPGSRSSVAVSNGVLAQLGGVPVEAAVAGGVAEGT
jgi:hypothetical protein